MSYSLARAWAYTVGEEVEMMIKNENALLARTDADEKTVYLPTRPPMSVACPRCWTQQRAERDKCFYCGTRFAYLDEEST